jgi:hypothetical protein
LGKNCPQFLNGWGGAAHPVRSGILPGFARFCDSGAASEMNEALLLGGDDH